MRDKLVIDYLIEKGTIPSLGLFDVTQSMIDAFYDSYRELYPPKSNKKLKGSNEKYAKKLAGLSLMKLNISRSNNVAYDRVKLKTTKPKCGIVYVISNPAFPGMYKVGMTRDLEKRLQQYQTSDPYRQYKVEHYKFVEDARKEEKEILQSLSINIVKGEWINTEQVKKFFVA